MRRLIGFTSFVFQLAIVAIFIVSETLTYSSHQELVSAGLIFFFITTLIWFSLSLTNKLVVMTMDRRSKLGLLSTSFASIPALVYFLAVTQVLRVPETRLGAFIGVFITVFWLVDIIDATIQFPSK